LRHLAAFFLALLFAAAAHGGAAKAPPPPPKERLLAGAEAARALMKKQGTEDEAKKMLRAYVDFAEITRRALGDHVKGKTAKQIKELAAALEEIVVLTNLPRVRENVEFTLEVTEEALDGKSAAVKSVGKSGERELLIDWKFMLGKSGWVIVDLAPDQVSLVETYRDQFNKIISEKGWKELMNKVHQRRDNLRKELAAATPKK
jgi:phospholipid transport system substrate-binding protein